MRDVFVTGTFRNDWNRSFNLKFANALESLGFSVYLPQRDSDQSGDRKRTFVEDVAGVDMCHMVIAIGSRTQTANWGFEIGYAYKSGKPVLILTDSEHPPELMTEGAATKIVVADNLDHMPAYIPEIEKWIKASSVS